MDQFKKLRQEFISSKIFKEIEKAETIERTTLTIVLVLCFIVISLL